MIIKEFSNKFCVSESALKVLGQFSSKFDT